MDFIDRLLFYFSKLYSSQIRKGQRYNNSKRIVIIAIIDYELELTKEINKMETIWRLRNDEKSEMILTDKIEIHIIELKKVKEEYLRNSKDSKTQWMMFMNNPEDKEVSSIMKENKGIKEAVVTVREMSEDEKMIRLAELREKAIMDEKSCYDTGLQDGRKEGVQEGIQKGMKESTIKMIKSMLKEKVDIALISKISEMPIEEIKKIKI